jgi:hypothetical protein
MNFVVCEHEVLKPVVIRLERVQVHFDFLGKRIELEKIARQRILVQLDQLNHAKSTFFWKNQYKKFVLRFFLF